MLACGGLRWDLLRLILINRLVIVLLGANLEGDLFFVRFPGFPFCAFFFVRSVLHSSPSLFALLWSALKDFLSIELSIHLIIYCYPFHASFSSLHILRSE